MSKREFIIPYGRKEREWNIESMKKGSQRGGEYDVAWKESEDVRQAEFIMAGSIPSVPEMLRVALHRILMMRS